MIPGTIPMPARAVPLCIFLGEVDDQSTSTNNDYSINFGAGAPGDVIVVLAGWSASNNRTPNSVTLDFGGSAVACAKLDTSGDSNQVGLSIWQAVANLSGTLTVRLVMSGGTEANCIAVYRLRGLDATAAVDTDGSRGSSTTSRSMFLDTPEGGIRIGGIVKAGTSNITLNALAEDGEVEFRSSGNTRFCWGSAADQPGANGVTTGGSWTTASVGCCAGASWR